MANMSLVLLLAGGAALLYFFGCNMGIQAICSLKGGGSYSLGGSTTTSTVPSTPASYYPPAVVNPPTNLLDPYVVSPTAMPGYDRVTMTEAMEYIANQVVEDIDKYTYRALGRNLKFEMKAQLLEHYKTSLTNIAEANDVRLQPLQGRALAMYSELLLELARRNDIVLNPGFGAAVRANLFAGSPTQGNITSNMAFKIA